MRRKVIITVSLTSLVFALALFCVGVYAFANQSFSISNTIGFTSSSVIYVSIEGSVANCEQMKLTQPPAGFESLEEYYKEKGLVYSKQFNEDLHRGEAYPIETWTIKEALMFTSSTEGIIYILEFWNYSDKPITIEVQELFDDTSLGRDKFMNIISLPITLGAYVNGNPPAYDKIEIETKVLDTSSKWQAENNFTVTLTML